MTEKKLGNKVFAIVAGAMLIAAAGLGAGFVGFDDTKEVNNLNTQIEGLNTDITDLQAELDNVEPVEVDNENLGIVLDHIYDNEGDISYLTEDLDDDEVEEIVNRIVFTNELKDKAVSEVKSDLFDELDKEVVGTVTLDEDDMERLKVDDRDYEIEVDVDDWKDGEALATVTGSFEQGGDLFTFTAELEFDDGKFDGFNSIDVVAE